MSCLLEFVSASPLPHDVSAPPYAIFGIYGSDITSSLPPRIPLKLILHFAPALQKWALPTPEPTYLPRAIARQSLRMPCVGIDVQASIDVAGLGWIIIHILHLGGYRLPKETFGVNPDLATSVAIHNAWLALELQLKASAVCTHTSTVSLYTPSHQSLYGV